MPLCSLIVISGLNVLLLNIIIDLSEEPIANLPSFKIVGQLIQPVLYLSLWIGSVNLILKLSYELQLSVELMAFISSIDLYFANSSSNDLIFSSFVLIISFNSVIVLIKSSLFKIFFWYSSKSMRRYSFLLKTVNSIFSWYLLASLINEKLS